MKPEHLAAIKSLLRALSIESERQARILAACRDGAEVSDAMITTRAAAGLLGVHPKTVFRYRARGLLRPVVRSARCIRWRQSEVAALANGGPGDD